MVWFFTIFTCHIGLIKLKVNLTSIKSSKTLYDKIVNKLTHLYNRDESRQLARMLLEECIAIPFEKIIIDEVIALSKSEEKFLEGKIDQLLQYQPIQYVLGKAFFYGRDFIVNPDVLIPRQETEELINEIIIDNKKPGLKILDVGSGSGCIGISLALELKDAHISSLEIDSRTLEVTRANAKKHNVELDYILEDILTLETLPAKYDIIVSNPPYVTEKEKELMSNNVLDHEPHKALFVPDEDPLLFYRYIVSMAKKQLLPNGKLYFEINEQFGPDILQLCKNEGSSLTKLVQDINGKDRIAKVRFD